MPYRRKQTYYVDIVPAGYPGRIGPLSTRSTNKKVAMQMEATVRELAALGRHEVLEALRDRRISLPELHTAKVTGRLEDLARNATDPVLFQNSAERKSVSLQGFGRAQPHHSRSTRRVLDPAPFQKAETHPVTRGLGSANLLSAHALMLG